MSLPNVPEDRLFCRAEKARTASGVSPSRSSGESDSKPSAAAVNTPASGAVMTPSFAPALSWRRSAISASRSDCETSAPERSSSDESVTQALSSAAVLRPFTAAET